MNTLQNSLVQRILIVLAAGLLMAWFYPHQRASQYIYEEGRPWNYNQLIAPFDIPIHPDSSTVQAVRDSLKAHFVPIYRLESTVVDSIINELPGESAQKKRLSRMLSKAYAGGVIDGQTMARIREGSLPAIRVLDQNILSETATKDFTTPRDIYLAIDSALSDPEMRAYFAACNLHDVLRANMIYDEVENDRYYQNAFETLTADRGVILQGQAIINKGDIVSAQDFTNLSTYETLLEQRLTKDSHSNILTFLGQLLYILVMLTVLMLYLWLFNPAIFDSCKNTCFIMLLVTLMFLLSSGLDAFIPGGVYIVPMAMVPIMVMVFFDSRTALFVATVACMLVAPIVSFVLEYLFLQLCACAVAVYSLRQLTRRAQLLRAALLVGVTYIVCYLAVELLMNGTLEGWTWRMPAFLSANAFLVSLVYVLMSVVERLFGYVSQVTMVELSDINQPLLRRLSANCPGTFQHSMAVGNLASDAALALGLNEQLIRAGALYHDIGKLSNPAFFTENQHGVNPHDALSPEQSAKIVINHVTDGLREADRAGLPPAIKDFIAQHHGTGKAKYFYIQACNAAPDGQCPDPTAFTYPGPNPRTRETSLLMMADSVEAASRSLKDYSKESIKTLVDKIIDGQIADGLHNDSELEFRDIPIIKKAFAKRLGIIYHSRIAYPDDKK